MKGKTERKTYPVCKSERREFGGILGLCLGFRNQRQQEAGASVGTSFWWEKRNKWTRHKNRNNNIAIVSDMWYQMLLLLSLLLLSSSSLTLLLWRLGKSANVMIPLPFRDEMKRWELKKTRWKMLGKKKRGKSVLCLFKHHCFTLSFWPHLRVSQSHSICLVCCFSLIRATNRRHLPTALL